MRLQMIINSSTAQMSRAAVLFRQPVESEDDWAEILEEISVIVNVTLAWRDVGGGHIFWKLPN
ncbi:DUF1654 domain-containing protein, partial [Pseudomonas syringae pv. tagetis]